ncbi:tetratricopeptide repeat protein [Streptobacillus canis]|uniref:tetratricopeptide repeat protein n=1 Tax=Streptobacillus canis TaxID=2678686 RepID=UPI0012E26C25|nr:tetratricopeptide repeat protein [Streptobacillus canis]
MLSTLVFREFRYNGNIEDLKTELKAKIAKTPGDVESLKKLAGIYHAYSQNDKAILLYEELSKYLPNDHEVEGYLGYLYYENLNLNEAEERLKNALYLSEREPFLLFLLGNVYSRKGMLREALDCYELAIFLDFDMYGAHIDFGRKYEHMGRHRKALKEFKAAYNIDSKDEELLRKIEHVENRIKEIEKIK